jgi:hypothetical protein
MVEDLQRTYDVRFTITITGPLSVDDSTLRSLLEKRMKGCVESVIPFPKVPEGAQYEKIQCDVRNFVLIPK